MGDSGDKPQQGEQVIAITDTHGSGVSPLPVAPGHKTAMGRCPDALKALQQVANAVGLDRRGAYGHRDAGVDATDNRQGMVNAGMLPHITEHPRHRKRTTRGRKR